MYFLPRVSTPGLITPSSITSPYLPRPGVWPLDMKRQHRQGVERLVGAPGAGIVALLDLLTLQPVERLVGGGGHALDDARLRSGAAVGVRLLLVRLRQQAVSRKTKPAPAATVSSTDARSQV